MKIITRDGRVFQGTPLQIVQAMKDTAFGVEDLSLEAYIDWVVDNARRFEGVELESEGADVEARAKRLVEDMVVRGLVIER